ncbi:C40 family peptidase [Micromonospora sp. Mcm103]|uniref:C40 family peptidase n=1 Tax=Micromonospora sp. Mcm103 TaxID=2926015 RepID=UPI0021C97FEE|nr:NlpC/P60 family protein [Micromonospora sp. Mcm103]
MAHSTKARRRRGRQPVISPILRPALWSALLGAVAAAALATPAWADPLPDVVPDTGSRPQVTGPLQLPGSSGGVRGVPGTVPGVPGTVPGLPGTVPGLPGVTVPGLPGAGATTGVTNPADGPLIAQINQLDARVTLLGEELLRIKTERDAAQTELTQSAARLTEAVDALRRAQDNAKSAAADAVKADAALPPGEFGASLREFANLQRITRGDKAEGATTSVTGELLRATSAEQIAREAHESAQRRATEKAAEFTRAEADLRKQETALVALRKENAAKLLEIERLADAAEQRLGTSYVDQSIDGLVADPKALAAVRYALAQLGDPYLWAAEGPDRFDCSGLMLASYQAAGYRGLPRVAKDQYFATRSRTVSPTALLPGDLLFFASGSSWTSVHHVAMYIGNGKMVEAPRTGDVVKISVVRWSRLYAATRVIGAVPAPATPAPPPTVPATPKPSTSPKPSATPKPSTTPKPTPTTPKPTTPTPKPTTSSPAPSSPPPSQTAEPEPEPSQSASAEPDTSSAAPSSSSVAPSRSSVAPSSSTSGSGSASPSSSAD